MGSHTHGTGRDAGPGRRRQIALAFSLAVIVVLIAAQTAAASFHLILVREVYAGAANDSYVVLQAYEGGQNLVSGHTVTAYDAAGGQIGEFTFGGNVSNGANNMTILVADSGYATTFPGGPTPNATMASLDLSAAGGAVCWAGVDCVSWGSFSGVTSPSAGAPAVAFSGGQALRRSIAGSCPTFLDLSDDTDQSSADFSLQTPNPRNNASPIAEIQCMPPAIAIDTKPPAKTKSTSAEFSFHSTPAGAEFECKLDSPTYVSCNGGSVNYAGPLAEGAHSFQVRAKNSNGTSSPATHNWEVDNTPPTTTIGNPKPPTPNPGTSLTFKFSADESGVTFACSLAKGVEADSFSSCSGSGKTYSGLTDGGYSFKVHATDGLGNVGTDASFAFTVDTSLQDMTPPETTITAKPTDPTSSTTVEFTYLSSEAGSTFECKIDAAPFASCAATGIVYTGLSEGPHSFQVRATDISANTDPTPAGHSFSVVLLAPAPMVPPSGTGSPDPAPPPPARRVAPPQTKVTRRPKPKSGDRTPTFKFKASAPRATFLCKLDGKKLTPCRSPLTTKPLRYGRHTFTVAAVAGKVRDGSPARVVFKVVRGR